MHSQLETELSKGTGGVQTLQAKSGSAAALKQERVLTMLKIYCSRGFLSCMNGLDRQSTFKAITVCGGLVRFGSLLRWKLQKHRQWIGISLNSGMTETKFARHLPWAT